ncbi:MAG TPA: serine protease [Anaerolineaceae bacterium]|nr:serine protease [Anaerolineaceae bacterium]
MKLLSFYRKLIPVLCVLILATLACTSTLPTAVVLPTAVPNGWVEVSTRMPTSAIQLGNNFDITVTISNTSQYNQRITGIQIPASFIGQANYVGSDPNLTATRDANGNLVMALNDVMAPQGSGEITFRFNSANPGTLSGVGTVTTDSGAYNFNLSVTIAGNTNPSGWNPGVSPTSTAPALGKIPYQAVVQIKAIIRMQGQDQVGWTGSGTIISKDGLILTNAHVVLAPRLYDLQYLVIALTVAQDQPPKDSYIASIVQADANMDIALIKPSSDLDGNAINYSALNLPFVPLGNSNALSLGDTITVLGYPGIGGETITLTKGQVSGFSSEQPYGNRAWIKTNATISGGNSGGLAVNDNGELIGVPSQVGSGDVRSDSIVDCRAIVDTNRDGMINDDDTCVPTGGFINALRPIQIAMPLIQKAMAGQVGIEAGTTNGESFTGSGKVIFKDDFSKTTSGWPSKQTDTGSKGYQNGYYSISVTEPNYLQWASLDYSYDNLIMSVDAKVLNPVGDSDFGFICGAQDTEHFWALEISEDGYYSIWRQNGAEYTALVDWTYADQIAAGGPYALAGYCGTQGLGLAVNGMLLGEIVDPNFQTGPVGLIVGTFSQPGITVGFDNYQLTQP